MKTSKWLVSVQQQVTGKVYGYVEVVAEDEFFAKKYAIATVKRESQYTNWWSDIGKDWCVYAVEL